MRVVTKRNTVLMVVASVLLAIGGRGAPAGASEAPFYAVKRLPWYNTVYTNAAYPASGSGPGTPALNAAVAARCNQGTAIWDPQWLSLPSAPANIYGVVRARTYSVVGGQQVITPEPSGFAFVDTVTGQVLSCGGSIPGDAPIGAHAFVAYFSVTHSFCSGAYDCGPVLDYYIYASQGPTGNNDWQHATQIPALPFRGHADTKNTTGSTAGLEKCFAGLHPPEATKVGPTAWWRFTATKTGEAPNLDAWTTDATDLTVTLAEATDQGPVFTLNPSSYGCDKPDVVAGKSYFVVVVADPYMPSPPVVPGADITLAVGVPHTPPSVPLSVHATAGPTPGSATITWEPPADDGGSPSFGYEVARDGTDRAGRAADFSTREGPLPRSFTFTYLRGWQTYRLSVAAVGLYGQGNAASVDVLVPAATPSVPQAVTARAGSARVTVSWQPPAHEGDSSITGYRIRRFVANTTSRPEAISTVDASARSITMTQLLNGRPYRFEIVAVNANGEGQSSNYTSYVIPTP